MFARSVGGFADVAAGRGPVRAVFRTVADLAASDDPRVSESAQLILTNLWNENGELILGPPCADAQDGAALSEAPM
jgi:hypothetical protein